MEEQMLSLISVKSELQSIYSYNDLINLPRNISPKKNLPRNKKSKPRPTRNRKLTVFFLFVFKGRNRRLIERKKK